MDPAERDRLVARYRDGYTVVCGALAGITADELDARPGAGEWSPREVVHHLADAEMMAATRVRRLIAEDDPVIQVYEEEDFARRLHYDRPIEVSLEVFRLVRLSTAEILACLDEDDWQRKGTHTLVGEWSVETWLRLVAAHAHDHADQIRRARASAVS